MIDRRVANTLVSNLVTMSTASIEEEQPSGKEFFYDLAMTGVFPLEFFFAKSVQLLTSGIVNPS